MQADPVEVHHQPSARDGYVFINCWLNGRRLYYTLVDGAAPTCITYDTLCTLLGRRVELCELQERNTNFVTWNGTPLAVRGVYRLNFRLGEWRVPNFPIYVVDVAPTGFVIGNNLLRQGRKVTIDWEAREIQVGSHLPVSFAHKSDSIAALRTKAGYDSNVATAHVLREIKLKPRACAYVQVCYSTPDQTALREGQRYFQPTPNVLEDHHVLAKEGVITYGLCGAIFVVNASDNFSATLKAGTLLGTLVPLEQVEQPNQATPAMWSAALQDAGVDLSDPPTPDDTQAEVATNLDSTTATVGEKDRTDNSIADPPLEIGEPPWDGPKYQISPDVLAAERERLVKLLADKLPLVPKVGVGLSKAPPMNIKLKPGATINSRNFPQRLEAGLKTMEMAEKLHEGHIIRRSYSPYNSPVVLARKADGTWRFCVDYRQVNAATERDAYQLPRPNDLLARLGGTTIFSVLDLASAFWQIRLAEEAKQFTAFSLLSGHWEFEVVPMGLTNSPAWMQRSLEGALGDILYRGALAYVDDIIIYARNYKEHYERLEKVLDRLREYGFRTRLDKCQFGYARVKFLGHYVSADGVRPHDRNLSKIRDCALPTDCKQLESCLALFSYYRRFIPNYANLARSLVNVLTEAQRKLREEGRNARRGKASIRLTDQEKFDFEEIKRLLCRPDNLLALPDWDKTFVLETDSSDFFGHATLSQYDQDKKLRPIEFYSFDLPSTLWKAGAYERELHCVMEGVRHFSNYLDFTQEFELRIDHRSLQHLHDQAITAAKYARLVQVLSVYRICWVHQPAPRHMHIDCFTRPPFTPTVEELTADADRMRERLGVRPAHAVPPHDTL